MSTLTKRVAIEDVQQACAKNGFSRPLRWTWAACPLGQIARAHDARDHVEWANKTYGEHYVKGFFLSFDNIDGEVTGFGERVQQGIEDGAIVREAYYPTPMRWSVI
jgi:hypothetical protein